ncbi:hypothetical protein [Sphingobium chungbukense]|uniref:hypothetical protein n=1 Tax=Sphingobium chungbukense TaxID=56193 RepID=UPI000A8497F2|nr:hypothetical protein [Sphingobium chungbukense]
MTSRELTGLLPLGDADALAARRRPRALGDWAWRIGFGAITWPWLLASLSGGRKADKRALLDELGLPHDALPHLGSWKADVGFLRHIVREIARARPANVVELGAGASTLIAARALAQHGGGRATGFPIMACMPICVMRPLSRRAGTGRGAGMISTACPTALTC